MRIGIALLLLGLPQALAEDDDAALLKRAKTAFRIIRTSDANLKSLRLDATLPFSGGAYRVRMAYAAPGRFCSVILSEDTKCPVGIARERGCLMYDAARSALYQGTDTGPPFLTFGADDKKSLQLRWGYSIDGDGEGIRLDLARLLDLCPVDQSVRPTKRGLVFEAFSLRGNKLSAILSDQAQPAVTRIELWLKGQARPIFLIDRLEIDAALPDSAFPVIDADDWKRVAPVEALFPAGWKTLPENEMHQLWTRRWFTHLLAYGALENARNRALVLPRTDAEAWELAKARHRKLTPSVLEGWRSLYGAATPPKSSKRVAELDAELEGDTPLEPTATERRLATSLLKKIQNVQSGGAELKRLTFEGTVFMAGFPALKSRVALDGDRFGMRVEAVEGGVPIAVADGGRSLLFDASGGRLLVQDNARCVAEFGVDSGNVGVSIGLDGKAKEAPHVALLFRDVIDQFPDARRAYAHPSSKGMTVLEARHERRGRLRYVCDPGSETVVREARLLPLRGSQEIVVFRLLEPRAGDLPQIGVAAFHGVLPVATLASLEEQWTAQWSDEPVQLGPIIYLALERLALRQEELRRWLPGRSKQHWIAFEQHENELTPKVKKAWAKAFGTLR